jgi:hypothetical protein
MRVSFNRKTGRPLQITMGRPSQALAGLGLCERTQNHEKEKNMNDNNRVLARNCARILSAEEIERVTGGIHTLTACTFDPELRSKDGDASIGEC